MIHGSPPLKRFTLSLRLNVSLLMFLWMPHGAQAQSWTPTSTMNGWQRQWDFNARPSLSADQGIPSRVGVLKQPRIHRLDIFGNVGRFSGSGGQDVGFAQVSHEVLFRNEVDAIAIRGFTRSPETVVRLMVESGDHRLCTYQAELPFREAVETFLFRSADFECFRRGRPVADAPPLALNHAMRIGFLVTRSSQRLQTEKEIPFDFSIQLLPEATD